MSGHESVETPIGNESDTQAHIDRSEQRMGLLHVSDEVMSWDGYDDFPIVALPVEFHMSDIEIHGDSVPLYPFVIVQCYYA